jgi:hypothetical protein
MQGITPQSALPLSTFYDKNHNPLNIPCEGPKAVYVTCDPSVDTDWTINFNYLFTQSQMSSVQGVFVDMGDFVQGESSGEASILNVGILVGGTNQRINVYSGQDSGLLNGQQQPFMLQGIWVPLSCINPPSIGITFDFVGTSFTGDPLLRLLFINHIPPQFSTSIALPPT